MIYAIVGSVPGTQLQLNKEIPLTHENNEKLPQIDNDAVITSRTFGVETSRAQTYSEAESRES